MGAGPCGWGRGSGADSDPGNQADSGNPADWNIRPGGKGACRLGGLFGKKGVRRAAERDGLLRSGRYISGDSAMRTGTALTKCESCYNLGDIWPFLQPVPASTY